MTYRVDRTALARRGESLARAVDALERKWTEIFWREVAPERGIAPPDAARPAQDLEAEIARLSARLSVLQKLESERRSITQEWERPPPLTGPPTQLLGRRPIVPWIARATDESLARVARYIEQDRSGVPYRAEARLYQTRNGTFLLTHLVTPIAPVVPHFTVRHETFSDDLRKLFGSKHDIQLGVDEFDGVFAIEGDEPTARAVLDRATRSTLLRMGMRGRVDVRIANGEARIGQNDLFTDDQLDLRWFTDAVGIAHTLRCAPVPALRA